MPLEDVLVAILFNDSDRPVGAGVVVERNLILTCAHVVNDALGRPSNQAGRPSQEEKISIRLHFPQRKLHAAIADGVECWTDPPADRRLGADICILRILDPDSFTQVAPLASMNNLVGKEFRSAGFPSGWDIDFAFGTIRGRDRTGLYLLRPEGPLLGALNDRGQRLFDMGVRPPGVIYKGFSGGPVEVEGAIAGIIVQSRDKIAEATAYMIPVSAFPQSIAPSKSVTTAAQESVAAVFQAPRAPVPFIGRESELVEIAAMLESNDAVLISSTFPGIGKTALASHLARRLRADYPDGIFWIRASNDVSETLFAAISAVGSSANPLAGQVTAEGLAQAFGQLISSRRALIIYDDVRFRDRLELIMPAGTKSKFILTSRIITEVDLEGLSHFPLSLLSWESALELLWHVSGRSDAATFERDASAGLVAELGRLPLAIRLAGRTIRALRCTVSEYLNYLLRDPDLRWIESDDSSESLSAAFLLSFQNLRSDNDRDFFRCLGLLRAVPVPMQAIGVALQQTDLATRLCVRNLLRAGLCEWIPGRSEVSVHPLLKRYAKQLSDKHDNVQTHRRLADWFERQLSIRDQDGGFRYSELITIHDIDAAYSAIHHFISIGDYLRGMRIAEVLADSLTRSGRHDVLQQLIIELERGGPLSPWLDLYRADFILTEMVPGDIGDAESILSELSAQSDAKIASAALICLARSSHRNKKIEESRSFLLKAKELKQNSQPPDERGIAYILNELARLELLSTDGVVNALNLHDEALRIQRRFGDVKGQAHTLRRIGSIFLRQKRNPRRASTYLTEACEAAERAGSTLILVHSLIELAEAEQRVSDFNAALAHLRKAQMLAGRSSDPFTSGRVEVRMGQVFEKLQMWGSAHDSYQKASHLLALSSAADEQPHGALIRVRRAIEVLTLELAEWNEQIRLSNLAIPSETNPEKRQDLMRQRKHASRMAKRTRQKLGLEKSVIRMRPSV